MFRSPTGLCILKSISRILSETPRTIFTITDEVSDAINRKYPMVALESTVITHGMPWPINFETAIQLESIVREEGVIPVTMGIMEGILKAGFTVTELEELAKSVNSLYKPVKVSRHNIYNYKNIKYGGTTVSGTMLIANKLGIKIFGTGGIGGVHREVQETMDISTDLRELSRTPLCVVSSGIKSFLDIPKTLEFMETEGVFVCTLNSEEFPGFFVHSSGIKSPNNMNSLQQIADCVRTMTNLKLESGMLLGIPIPNALEDEGRLIHEAITESLERAKLAKITGSHITPYILNEINLITNGKSLILNVELIKNNVRIAAKLAKEFQRLGSSDSDRQEFKSNGKGKHSFVMIGGCLVDSNIVLKDPSVTSLVTLTPRATYSCETRLTCGGVARNIAEVFHRLNEKCYFLSALGKDSMAKFTRENSHQLDFSRVKTVTDFETGTCSIISCQNQEILFHLGNLSILQTITTDYLAKHLTSLKDDLKMICFDCNLSEESMEYIINFAKLNHIKVFIETTDILLATKPLKIIKKLSKTVKNPVDIISPNIFEFDYMIQYMSMNEKVFDLNLDFPRENLNGIFQKIKYIMKNSDLLDFIPRWIIKLGQDGVVFASKKEVFLIKQSMFFIPKRQIIKTSGAGDCLVSCALLLHYKRNLSWKDSIAGSLRIAKEALLDEHTVPSSIKWENYSENEIKNWSDEMFERKLIYYRL